MVMGMMKKTAIIAHRGASGYIPEHSLAAYSLAIDMGADYVEPDLVLSKDGVFFALHDLLLDDTTNILDFPQYLDRLKTRLVEGRNYTGYFVNDFDSQELKLLNLKQRLPKTRSVIFDDHFRIPTLTEIFDLMNNYSRLNRNKVGLYIELKHPLYYRDLGFLMDDMILQSLADARYSTINIDQSLSNTISPIVLQCFIPETLIALRSKCDLPLVQLIGISEKQNIDDIWNIPTLDLIKEYANGIGPPLNIFTDTKVDYELAISMIDQATHRNLVVHPYALKSDEEMTSFNSRYHGNSTRETLFFVCCLNVHGIFTDYTDRTKAAVDLTFHNPQICSDICPSKFSSSLLQIPSSTTHSRIFEKWELSTILYYLLILLVLFYFRTSIKFNFRATVY